MMPPVGKSGPGMMLHQLVERDVRVGDQGQRGVDHLAGVVGRDVGGHADGDAAAAVDQQVGEGGRQHLRLLVLLVVVRAEIDGVLVDVGQHVHGGAGQAALGVAHRRRGVAVDGAEIALAVDQRHAQAERLRHADHGVVDRGVAVRVVLAHHLADDAGGLAVRLVVGEAALVHGIQDAAVHGLQPVPRVRQRAADDHRHGVVEVGAAHLLLEHHRMQVGSSRGDGGWACRSWVRGGPRGSGAAPPGWGCSLRRSLYPVRRIRARRRPGRAGGPGGAARRIAGAGTANRL